MAIAAARRAMLYRSIQTSVNSLQVEYEHRPAVMPKVYPLSFWLEWADRVVFHAVSKVSVGSHHLTVFTQDTILLALDELHRHGMKDIAGLGKYDHMVSYASNLLYDQVLEYDHMK